ncbi:MAG: lipid-A-disaccharide synthase [Holosporales bacterium]|jgi:lipid-A-disaccharide synthase|nr:lipid-A-disaccharide synthase [Holosporales bacterium]
MKKRLYIIAGEPSGDFLGSFVINKLKTMHDFEITGIGGKFMEEAGLKSLFDINEISIAGITEIIPHILKIKKLINFTVNSILKNVPHVLLTIDSPGFCFRVAKLIKKKNPSIKLIHLVAPSVWAWRSKRAVKLAKLYDHLLTLFDFEPKYFIKHNLKTTFVGHPAIEKFENSDNVKSNTVLLLPGSRTQEIKLLLPIFLEAVKSIDTDRIVISTLPHLKPLIKSMLVSQKMEIISDEEKKAALYRTAKLAIVSSGTATLQLALSGCPMVVCYRLSWISYAIIRALVKVDYISLVNIILNHSVVPELIQNDCNADFITKIANSIDIEFQIENFKKLRTRLMSGNIPPSEKIAQIVKDTEVAPYSATIKEAESVL